MLFNSYIFIFAFLPLALFAYYLLGKASPRAAGLSLVASSVVFYAWWSPTFALLLVGSTIFNYLVSLAIVTNDGSERRQNAILALGIVTDLVVLAHYKYVFAIAGFLDTMGMTHLRMDPVILPLGISFYTFTQIGYLIDCRQGMARERGFFEYFLFVTFFPHLIAGPIIHHREIMPQFAKAETYRFDRTNMAIGLTMFIIGLCKKVLLADSLIQISNAGFSAPHAQGLMMSWLTALSYSLQIYFDFSGYSDMAIGLAFMFNIRFPLNFNSPYKARNIIDFWQRWHMTLTRYLTLYLYNPMAIWIARRRAARKLPISTAGAATAGGFFSMIAAPIFITMALAGIWHGAGLQFLIFGLLHGAYLTINHAWRTFAPARLRQPPASWAGRMTTATAQVALTYLAILVAQVFFRAASSGDAIGILSGMTGFHGVTMLHGWPERYGSFLNTVLQVSLYFGIVWFMPNSQQIMEKFSPALGQIQKSRFGFLQWNPSLRWAVLMGVACSLVIASLSHHTEFLYFQF